MAPGLDLPHHFGPFGIKQLHTDLYKGLLRPLKPVQKGQSFLFIFKIQCYDHVICHDAHLL